LRRVQNDEGHVVKTGKTPVLDAKEWRTLLDAIPTATVRDLRDRALIATLTYSFARITAALTMKVEDLVPKGAGWQLRLHEKGGKHHVMPCHHALAEALRAYIDALASRTTARDFCSARRADTKAPSYPSSR
jgi:integrase